MPFEDLTGNSGFTSDSDGASANLDINLSEDSARNLWDVQAAVQQIATDFQTAVRAAADFQSYLISIRETSQTVKMPSLGMEGGEGGNMSYSGGRVDTGSVPLVQSELGMANRIGEMEENASGAGGGALAAIGGGGAGPGINADEIVNQFGQAAWLASAMGGNHIPQETITAYDRAYQYGQRFPKKPAVKNASFAGQSGTARAYAASQLISQNLPAAQQFLRGGGVGGIAGAFGRLGTFGLIGYSGYQLVDAGLETYAQSRALAISANNSQYGTGWGFGERLSQAGMAASPFISGEDAAAIYGLAIDQGWASRAGGGFPQGDFSQAVNFMYDAAKDYNIKPQQSAQLLQTNALGAGQSIEALSENLLTLKKTLDGTGVSMSAAASSFQDFNSFLISSGANPADASRIATGTIKSFAQNTYFGPNASGSALVMGALQNPQVRAVLGGLTGNLPGAALAGGNADKSLGQLENIVHGLAVQYSSQTGVSKENRAAMFAVAYNSLTGQNIDQKAAEELMYEAAADPHFITRGQKDVKSNISIAHQSGISAWWHGLDDWSGWAGSQTGAKQSIDQQEKNSALINSYGTYSPEINTLLSSSGDNLSNLVLYGPDGQPVMVGGNRVAGANIAKWFGDEANYNKFSATNSGYYIQDINDKSKSYNAANISSGGTGGGVTSTGATNGNTVYITLSDQAKKWFNTNVDKMDLATGKN